MCLATLSFPIWAARRVFEKSASMSSLEDPKVLAIAARRWTRIPLSPPSLDSIGSGSVSVKCLRTSAGT